MIVFWMWKTSKLVMNQVKFYQDARFMQAQNQKEKS